MAQVFTREDQDKALASLAPSYVTTMKGRVEWALDEFIRERCKTLARLRQQGGDRSVTAPQAKKVGT